MSIKTKKTLAYNIGLTLAKMTTWSIYLICIYIILNHFNIFKIELVTDTIQAWLEIVICNNLFIWNL